MLGTLISVVVGVTLALLLLLILLIFVVSPLSYIIFAAIIRPLFRRAAALLAAPLLCPAEPADWALRIHALRQRLVDLGALAQSRDEARSALRTTLVVIAAGSLAVLLLTLLLVACDGRPLAEAGLLGLSFWSVLTRVIFLFAGPVAALHASSYLSASEALRSLSVEVSAVNQARGGALTLAERDAWRGLLTEHGARLGALSEVGP